ncbi:PRC-barrel domain-containing protein [Roseitalea porphyridii]|uniref:PRC-barrel domain containing protein n=1 Tax=Roseitalea porphyridii TaxID=1852022 RepID=A0A4V1A3P5_9HYPH|nr:PRC-barrel domain-containing protein [Roseitalea porphyridii]QBK29838.1 PRC-barrel domain containing protein [Roseitalea porphyridii]
MKRLLATTALVAVMAMPAMADNHTMNTADAEQTSAAQYASGDMTIRVTDLMNRAVFMPEGGAEESMFETPYTDAPNSWENIADVEDVLITPEGEITAVVIDAGGFLGIGEKRTRVSLDNLRFVPDDDDEGEYFVVFTGDRQLLEDSEEYMSGDQTAEATDSEGGEELSTREVYAEAQDDMATGEGSDDQMMAEGEGTAAEGEAATDDQMMAEGEGEMTRPERDTLDPVDVASLTAEDLEDARVYAGDSNWVGEIGDLVLDENGNITHVVVDFGGFLGIGEKPVALDFDQVDIRRGGEGLGGATAVYVDATEEELESMERWDG